MTFPRVSEHDSHAVTWEDSVPTPGLGPHRAGSSSQCPCNASAASRSIPIRERVDPAVSGPLMAVARLLWVDSVECFGNGWWGGVPGALGVTRQDGP